MKTMTKDELMNVNGGRRYEVLWSKPTAGGYYTQKVQVYNNGHKAGIYYRKVSRSGVAFEYSITKFK